MAEAQRLPPRSTVCRERRPLPTIDVEVVEGTLELLEIGKNKMAKKGGRARANPPPALTRVEQEDPDSSDEELYRLMEQGSRGQ